MLGILIVLTLIALGFDRLGFTEANIITLYILGVLLISLCTKGYTFSVLSSLLSVLLFNFFFTEPKLTFQAFASGYPVTFVVMLVSAIITGTLVSKLKEHAKISAQTAFRTRVMFDTNQLLQKAKTEKETINIVAGQLMKMLERDVIVYPVERGAVENGYLFRTNEIESVLPFEEERDVVEWVFTNKKKAGAGTDFFSNAKGIYFAVRINDQIFAVVGVFLNGKALDSFESSLVLSILGECALAIENLHNEKEKEEAAILAKNEQTRANLLRAISHDLRTPLTSISGNAANLMAEYDKLTDEMRMQIFEDIHEDSHWLIGLVENLLSVSRIEEGQMALNPSVHLLDEIVEEALRHINRKRVDHKISVEYKSELVMVKIDAKLIMQVVINLVENAIKYTPPETEIKIIIDKNDNEALISVADTGEGIPDKEKKKVFEMFYTGEKNADSRRSLGLGLSLCKSIVFAHRGEIMLSDNIPNGCVFTVSLPLEEVTINE